MKYLGSPYSKYPHGLAAAFVEAARATGLLMARGVNVISPIVASHPVAMHGNLDPRDYKLWMPLNYRLMEAADALIVLMLDGWETSVGLTEERAYFARAGKPEILMTPGVFPEGLL